MVKDEYILDAMNIYTKAIGLAIYPIKYTHSFIVFVLLWLCYLFAEDLYDLFHQSFMVAHRLWGIIAWLFENTVGGLYCQELKRYKLWKKLYIWHI